MEDGILKGRGRGLMVSLLVSFLSLGILLYVTWEDDTLASLELLNFRGMLPIFLLVVLLWLVEGLRIKSLLRAAGSTASLSMVAASRVFLITFFGAGITPWALGEWPAHILALTYQQVAPGEAAAAALLRSFFTKGVLVLWSGVIIFFFDGLGAAAVTGRLFQGAFLAVTLSSFGYFAVMIKPGVAVFILDLLRRFKPTRHLYEGNRGVARLFISLLAEARRFRSSLGRVWERGPILLLWPLFLTVVYWALYFSIAPLILWGFGIYPPYMTTFGWQVMIFLILSYVPIPGGSGAAEFGAATLFVAFVPSPIIGVFIAVWRFFTYYLHLLFGGLAFFFVLNKKRQRP